MPIDYIKYPVFKKWEELGEEHPESGDGRETKVLEFIHRHPALEEMRGNPRRICEAIDEFAANNDFLINIGSDKGRKVANLIAEEKPKVFVELGGYIGYSAILFADQMRRSVPAGTKVEYWSLEFEPLYAAVATVLVDLAGLSDVVKYVVGPAEESLKKLKAEGKVDHIDMFFLDHVEEIYDADLKICESLGLLKSGACIVADNVLRPGAPRYREYVRANPKLETRAIKGLIVPGDFEDEVDVSKVK